MSRYFIAVIAALALLTTGVLSTPAGTSISLTAASFSAAPSTVFDNTNSAAGTAGADFATWGADYLSAYFGPASTNETVITYGLDDLAVLTKMIVRSTNGSLVSNGTADTTLYAKKSDATATLTTATVVGISNVAVGLGSVAIAYTAAVSGASNAAHQNLYLLIVSSAGAVTVQKAVVSTAETACVTSTTNGLYYTYTIGNVFYENSTYYVSYTTVSNTVANAACTAVTSVETKASIQGFAVDSTPTPKWTAAVDFATSTTFASGTFSPQCGPSNYTNSTTFYCTVWSSATAATASISAYPITVSSGTVGSAVTIATNSDPTSPAGTIRYTVAGFVYGMYQQGILLSCVNTVTSPSSVTNTLNLYNFTSGATSTTGATAGGIALTGFSTTTSGATYSGAGVQNGTGFLLLTQYVSTAAVGTANAQSPAVTTFQYTTYNSTGAKQGDSVTVGTVAGGRANWFVDAYGALWFGAYSNGFETAASGSGTVTNIYKGQVGKVLAQLYDSAGNVLVSFFALVSLMIAALFAF